MGDFIVGGPASALPPEDWFSINSIVADMCLTSLTRRERVLAGYFLEATVDSTIL